MMLGMFTRGGLAALALLAGAITAKADGEIDKLMTAADKARLASYDKVRAEAIADAKTRGAARDIATRFWPASRYPFQANST